MHLWLLISVLLYGDGHREANIQMFPTEVACVAGGEVLRGEGAIPPEVWALLTGCVDEALPVDPHAKKAGIRGPASAGQ